MMSLSPELLFAAWKRVRANAPSRRSILRFERNLDRELRALHQDLHSGTYHPAPTHQHSLPRAGRDPRILSIPTVRDRVAQRAFLDLFTPKAERLLSHHVHGFRPRRSPKTALADLTQGLPPHAPLELANVDVANMFDTLRHSDVRAVGHTLSTDPGWRRLLDLWLEVWAPSKSRGVPQGAPLSPLLANLTLHRAIDMPLVTWLRRQGMSRWIRYGDDIAVLTWRRGQALKILAWLSEQVRTVGLELGPAKTRLISGAGSRVSVARILGQRLDLRTPSSPAWRTA